MMVNQELKKDVVIDGKVCAKEILWTALRNEKFMNLKFLRKYEIGEYIIDFYCSYLRLVIEINGDDDCSEDNLEYDSVKSAYINFLGLKVIRFNNDEVLENLTKVLERLKLEVSL